MTVYMYIYYYLFDVISRPLIGLYCHFQRNFIIFLKNYKISLLTIIWNQWKFYKVFLKNYKISLKMTVYLNNNLIIRLLYFV